MDSHSLTRKDFITLTITLIGGGALAAGCSSASNAGTGGTGAGGSTGTGGAGGSGAGGTLGIGGKTTADAAADSAGDVQHPDTANNCADPLPAGQLADATGHTHSMEIAVSTLAMTGRTPLLSGPFPTTGSGGHFHQIVLSPADLDTLRGGGSVTVTSDLSGAPEHSHMFMVACHSD
jgi:hypothetical protein